MSDYVNVIQFLPNDDDPLYLPGVSADALADPVSVSVDLLLADGHGIALDAQGFPESSSLEAWHEANNPHLFGGAG